MRPDCIDIMIAKDIGSMNRLPRSISRWEVGADPGRRVDCVTIHTTFGAPREW